MDDDITDAFIICPYCKHVHNESFEWQPDEGKGSCERCSKEFNYRRDIDISYTAWKSEED